MHYLVNQEGPKSIIWWVLIFFSCSGRFIFYCLNINWGHKKEKVNVKVECQKCRKYATGCVCISIFYTSFKSRIVVSSVEYSRAVGSSDFGNHWNYQAGIIWLILYQYWAYSKLWIFVQFRILNLYFYFWQNCVTSTQELLEYSKSTPY